MSSNSFSTARSRACPSFIISIISLYIVFVNGQTSLYHLCSNGTGDANYKTDVATLLDSLSQKASTETFYNDSLNQIYGLYLCRGDVNASACQSCVKTASQEIQDNCASNKTAIIWYDKCMLRYSNETFFGIMKTRPAFLMYNFYNRSDPDERDFGALALVNNLMGDTPYSKSKFATTEKPSTDQEGLTLYGLAQCTRDIDGRSCYECLESMDSIIRGCCQQKKGWRALGPNCNIRYEQYSFLDDAPAPPPDDAPAPPPVLAQPPPPDPGELNLIYIYI